MTWWAVALGAAIGAPSRFLVDAAIARRTGHDRPWGTLVVNVSGAAVLGTIAGLFARGLIDSTTYALLGIGFCGAYTTFSTFVWESLTLIEDGLSRTAFLNVALTIVIGLGVGYSAYLLAAPSHLAG